MDIALEYTGKTFNLGQLNEEALAVPALENVTVSGRFVAVYAVSTPSLNADGWSTAEVVFMVPDQGSDQANAALKTAVDAVVAAHVAAPPPPPPPTQAEKVAAALAQIAADPTLDPSVQTALTAVVKALT